MGNHPFSKAHFMKAFQQLHTYVGFTKGYNFVLWFIFCNALLGFCLSRLIFLNFNGKFCSPGTHSGEHAAAGECYRYTSYKVYNVGIKLHLYTIIPAGILAYIQFVPIIRHKLIILHRINGYIVVLMTLVGIAGAIIIAPVSFGGGLEIQGWVGTLTIMVVGSLALAYYSIKRLQIDQHRAWMLRAWFYAGSIITLRFIMGISAIIISSPARQHFKPKLCHELATMFNTTALLHAYPDCTSLDAWVLVQADLTVDSPANQSAALNLTFGMAAWIATTLHAIGVEFYINMTPTETQRLRKVSHQRQIEAGLTKPDRAILTTDHMGIVESSTTTHKHSPEQTIS